MENLNVFLNRRDLSEIEKLKLMELQNDINKLYPDAAEGTLEWMVVITTHLIESGVLEQGNI